MKYTLDRPHTMGSVNSEIHALTGYAGLVVTVQLETERNIKLTAII